MRRIADERLALAIAFVFGPDVHDVEDLHGKVLLYACTTLDRFSWLTAFENFLNYFYRVRNHAAAGARLRSRSSHGQAIKDIATAAFAGSALAVSVTVLVIAVHSFACSTRGSDCWLTAS